jgi:hypothetical protein
MLLAFASIAALSACGPANNTTPTPGPGSTSSSSSTTSKLSTGSAGLDATGGITVGQVVFQSTLKPPSQDFGLSALATQDDNGITLTVDKPGNYTFSELKDFHSIPQDLAVHVFATEATPSKIYYGVSCRGYGENEKYLLVADATGQWVIVQVKDGSQKVLKQGTAGGVDASKGVQIDAACVTPKSNDKMNHIVLALNGKVVGSVDDDFNNVSISNSFQLFAISPDPQTTGTGSVTFDRLQVYSASAA